MSVIYNDENNKQSDNQCNMKPKITNIVRIPDTLTSQGLKTVNCDFQKEVDYAKTINARLKKVKKRRAGRKRKRQQLKQENGNCIQKKLCFKFYPLDSKDKDKESSIKLNSKECNKIEIKATNPLPVLECVTNIGKKSKNTKSTNNILKTPNQIIKKKNVITRTPTSIQKITNFSPIQGNCNKSLTNNIWSNCNISPISVQKEIKLLQTPIKHNLQKPDDVLSLTINVSQIPLAESCEKIISSKTEVITSTPIKKAKGNTAVKKKNNRKKTGFVKLHEQLLPEQKILDGRNLYLPCWDDVAENSDFTEDIVLKNMKEQVSQMNYNLFMTNNTYSSYTDFLLREEENIDNNNLIDSTPFHKLEDQNFDTDIPNLTKIVYKDESKYKFLENNNFENINQNNFEEEYIQNESLSMTLMNYVIQQNDNNSSKNNWPHMNANLECTNKEYNLRNISSQSVKDEENEDLSTTLFNYILNQSNAGINQSQLINENNNYEEEVITQHPILVRQEQLYQSILVHEEQKMHSRKRVLSYVNISNEIHEPLEKRKKIAENLNSDKNEIIKKELKMEINMIVSEHAIHNNIIINDDMNEIPEGKVNHDDLRVSIHAMDNNSITNDMSDDNMNVVPVGKTKLENMMVSEHAIDNKLITNDMREATIEGNKKDCDLIITEKGFNIDEKFINQEKSVENKKASTDLNVVEQTDIEIIDISQDFDTDDVFQENTKKRKRKDKKKHVIDDDVIEIIDISKQIISAIDTEWVIIDDDNGDSDDVLKNKHDNKNGKYNSTDIGGATEVIDLTNEEEELETIDTYNDNNDNELEAPQETDLNKDEQAFDGLTKVVQKENCKESLNIDTNVLKNDIFTKEVLDTQSKVLQKDNSTNEVLDAETKTLQKDDSTKEALAIETKALEKDNSTKEALVIQTRVLQKGNICKEELGIENKVLEKDHNSKEALQKQKKELHASCKEKLSKINSKKENDNKTTYNLNEEKRRELVQKYLKNPKPILNHSNIIEDVIYEPIKQQPDFVKVLFKHRKTTPDLKYWQPMRSNTIYELFKVHPCSSEARFIIDLFQQTSPYYEIYDLERIQNPYLMTAYLLNKERAIKEYGTNVESQLLYHGTKYENCFSIALNNFDWRLYGHSRGHKYGKGVNFTPNANFAINFCDKRDEIKLIILAKVLVVKSCRGDENSVVPPGGYDSTKRGDGQVIVKYNDDTFYPAYKILARPIYRY